MIPGTTPVITLTEQQFLAMCKEALGPNGIERTNRDYVDQYGWDMSQQGFLKMRFNLCDRALRAVSPGGCCQVQVGIGQPEGKTVILFFYDDAAAVHFKLRFAEIFAC